MDETVVNAVVIALGMLDGATPELVAAVTSLDRDKVAGVLGALTEVGACQHVYRLTPGENMDAAVQSLTAREQPAA